MRTVLIGVQNQPSQYHIREVPGEEGVGDGVWLGL
jgi:hypothetical protein